jgi:hypothetical protein
MLIAVPVKWISSFLIDSEMQWYRPIRFGLRPKPF